MTPILANTITADMGLIPGMAIISPLFGLPLSVLAAVIERPFYSAAGVERHAVWYSIQANVVSLLIGYPIVLLVAFLSDVVGEVILALWPFAAVAISTYIEWKYLNAKARVRRRLSLGAVLGANVLSALVCVLMLVPLYSFDRPDVKLALRPYQSPLSIVLGIGCIVATVAAFIIPRRGKLSEAATGVGGVDGLLVELRSGKSV